MDEKMGISSLTIQMELFLYNKINVGLELLTTEFCSNPISVLDWSNLKKLHANHYASCETCNSCNNLGLP